MTKKTAAVLVTYNGEQWLERCLSSLKTTFEAGDIFAVDNHSTDASCDILKKHGVHLTPLTENLGFGAANNLILNSLKDSGYDYFFLVNQDLYIEDETLAQLVSFAEKNPEVGITAPIQYDGTGNEIDANFKQYLKNSEGFGDYYRTTFCNAAAWLLSKNCLERVGFFSSCFPHYGEDRNFCERAIFHGFEIAILKNTKVCHDRNQKMTPEKALKMARIKLLTIFLNPAKTQTESWSTALYSVFGLSKFLLLRHRLFTAIVPLSQEFLRLFKKRTELEAEKSSFK